MGLCVIFLSSFNLINIYEFHLCETYWNPPKGGFLRLGKCNQKSLSFEGGVFLRFLSGKHGAFIDCDWVVSLDVGGICQTVEMISAHQVDVDR